ncbi:MAG: 3-phosphoshikimate 1-carboxyvinyltransferase [Acidobacteria bacterium RIFCSPLOWO2_12_FULL_65_11]|nr:MAG: 3-phosphoshikimate 1-carboxyvinyltransferase [Acidobacteria bacterium RIFCSPLOWO2_12_FULL_65_11]
MTLAPAARIRGRLRVPGDKSISHRYAIVAALAEGRSSFEHFAPGADCHSTLSCLRQLGVDVKSDASGTVTIEGRGLGSFHRPAEALDAGNSGTTLRLLMGGVAGHRFSCRLVGDSSLSRRPMRRVIEPIEQMGARIEATDGHAPLTVHGAQLHGVTYHQRVASAQVKSAVLLAGLHAEGVTSVVEPAATRGHTERALLAFGGDATTRGLIVSVAGGQHLGARILAVPGDFSSAAFWLVAAAALPESSIEIEDVGLNPTRTGLLEVLRRFGARVHVEVTTTEGHEPRGIVRVEHDRSGAVTIAPEEVPGLIDELPAIAALAAHGGEVTVTGAAELRVKESDRIAVLVAGFRALGIAADERVDGFVVGGARRGGARSERPSGGRADARGDHRMAMAFAIAALAARQPSTIDGADAVVISYPGFFETLDRLIT